MLIVEFLFGRYYSKCIYYLLEIDSYCTGSIRKIVFNEIKY